MKSVRTVSWQQSRSVPATACGKIGILAKWMVRNNDMTLLDRAWVGTE